MIARNKTEQLSIGNNSIDQRMIALDCGKNRSSWVLTKTMVFITCLCTCLGLQLSAINQFTDKYLAEHPGSDAIDTIWEQGRTHPEYLKDPAFAADYQVVSDWKKSQLGVADYAKQVVGSVGRSGADTLAVARIENVPKPYASFWLGAIAGLLSVVVCIGFHRLLTPSSKIISPKLLGQTWAAWSIIPTCVPLGRFFRTIDAESFLVWLVVAAVFYSSGFIFGWLYGRLVRFRKALTASAIAQPTPEISQPSKRTLNDQDDAYYKVVSQEILSGSQLGWLWLKAQTETDGDNEKAEILYAKHRVQQLKEADERRT